MLIGRFSLLEAARRAKVVRWSIDIEETVWDRLVQFIEEDLGPKVLKKKGTAAKVAPNDGGDEKRLCRALLLFIILILAYYQGLARLELMGGRGGNSKRFFRITVVFFPFQILTTSFESGEILPVHVL